MTDVVAIETALAAPSDVVVYPHMVLPLFVGREKSIEALEEAIGDDKQVLLVAQRNASDRRSPVSTISTRSARSPTFCNSQAA